MAPLRAGIGRQTRSYANDHIDDAVLQPYVLGTLTNDATEAVEMHLLVCDICRHRLTDTDVYLRAMKSALKNFPLEIAVEDGALSER